MDFLKIRVYLDGIGALDERDEHGALAAARVANGQHLRVRSFFYCVQSIVVLYEVQLQQVDQVLELVGQPKNGLFLQAVFLPQRGDVIAVIVQSVSIFVKFFDLIAVFINIEAAIRHEVLPAVGRQHVFHLLVPDNEILHRTLSLLVFTSIIIIFLIEYLDDRTVQPLLILLLFQLVYADFSLQTGLVTYFEIAAHFEVFIPDLNLVSFVLYVHHGQSLDTLIFPVFDLSPRHDVFAFIHV